MHILSVIHGTDARAELFAPAVEEAGHRLDEWSFGWGTPPPRPLDAYDAVLVFGGAMHADQDAHHPWLREETLWLQQVLDRHTPVLGVCLGVQLIARAAGAWVGRMPDGPEIGGCGVGLTEAVRLGDACWGVQFHPEVTAAQLEGWVADTDDPPPDADRLRAETLEKMGRWNDLGRTLCAAFLATAESLLAQRSSRVA